MIHFPLLSTVRLRVQMHELSIGQSMAIAGHPEGSEEAANTLMLRSCAGETNIDPQHWTLQERALGVGQYLMAINTDQPDFPIGDKGKFTDYLQPDHDIDPATVSAPLYLGQLSGDHWGMQHLYGYMLESIERVQGMVDMPPRPDGQRQPMTPRMHWLFGCMAAQMVRVTAEDGTVQSVVDEIPAPEAVGAYDDWLMQRMRIFSAWPDNQFAALYMLYRWGKGALSHLFDWEFSIEGRPVFLPRPDAEKEAGAALPPANFPVDACLSPAARELGRKHESTSA